MAGPTKGGAAAQNRETQAMTLRLPTDVYEAMRALSFATQTSINELVLRAIASFLADSGHQEAVDALADRMRDQYEVALDKLKDM